MKADINNKPVIKQGWLRVIVFVLFFFAFAVIAEFVIQRLVPSADKNTPNQNVFYLQVIVTAIVSIALVWLFRKIIDRRSFDSIGFSIDKNGVHAGTGFFLGILLLCTGTCILYFTGNLIWTDIVFNGNDLFISFGLMVIVAFYEEIVFRGYILNNLLESGNKWIALLISAFIFALAHTANPDFTIIGACNIFLAGILLGINYSYTKNLWFSIMLHFTWNFLQGPILGYDVSGNKLQSLFQHDTQGSTLLTGGKFGFEGSLVATLLCALSIVAIGWVYEKKYFVANPSLNTAAN